MNSRIDLRSDTVTRPSAAMRKAMEAAKVGDDVMGDDPTVTALEDTLASMFGKEAAMFVPSGTMANLLAILAQTHPGDEILTHRESHIFYYEGGGYAAVAGCSIKFVEDPHSSKLGLMSAQALKDTIRPSDIHFPKPKLFTIENTHNRGGGIVWPIEMLNETCQLAAVSGLKVHTDGARIWNAAIALGIDLAPLAAYTNTISVCLSKGLGCPVGSVLIGDKETIERARHKRKMLGGGMRQAGILAAAGLYAIKNNFQRLELDHARAQKLALDIAELPIFDFDPSCVETNLIYAKLSPVAMDKFGDAFALEKVFSTHGVLCFAESTNTIRFVTHLDIDDDMLEETVVRIRNI
ncbi:MAG: low-specificity L-threonine aldolase [Phycisphaerales bacterium]